ncbi:tyrosine-type recombinase/integrase [Nocardia asiatica]|uniref:tyrosine-type recombinase/integrase n=1 Tax=Nocardia asiatica TaxID=209252 RepID=UPI003EE26A3D
MSRRVRGGGSVYRRKDGRWEGAVYLPTASGASRRIRVYGKTAKEVSDKLAVQIADVERGIPVPERSWTVGAYLDYYMSNIAPKKLRPSTIELYEGLIRRYIRPALGSHSLVQLTVSGLQQVVDDMYENGVTAPTLSHIRTVLMSALTNAMREDLVVRNVARLVRIGQYERRYFKPWNATEVRQFLSAIKNERLYVAYLISALYGTRRGEVLGLRWSDIDWDHNVIRLRQQLSKVNNKLQIGPLKTKRSKRDLMLLAPVRQALIGYRHTMEQLAIEPTDDWGLIFRSSNGSPVDPQIFSRYLFHKLTKKAGLRKSRLHGLRHSTATILKNLGVPDKDIQAILGHSRVAVTQDLYEHADVEVQQQALTKLECVLLPEPDGTLSRQLSPSKLDFVDESTSSQSVNWPENDHLVFSIARMVAITSDSYFTPVVHQLRARTNTYIVGSLAVSLAVKDGQPDKPNSVLWQWISLRDALAPQPRRFVDRLAVTASTIRSHD